jgi:hypothetical protein
VIFSLNKTHQVIFPFILKPFGVTSSELISYVLLASIPFAVITSVLGA